MALQASSSEAGSDYLLSVSGGENVNSLMVAVGHLAVTRGAAARCNVSSSNVSRANLNHSQRVLTARIIISLP